MALGNLMHDLQDELVDRVLTELVTELFVRKLGKQGLRISRRKKQAAKGWVRGGCKGTFVFSRAKSKRDRNITLTVTSREARRLKGKLMRITENCAGEAIAATTKRMAKPLLKSLHQGWLRSLPTRNRDFRGFERRHMRRWRKPFELLALQQAIAHDVGDSLNDEARKKLSKKKAPMVEVLTRLHARACQVGLEVLALLQKGYADGAIARWRCLHEIAVVAMFVWEHGGDVAERYLNHEIIESTRAAEEYAQKCERLGDEPIPERELNELRKSRDALLARYGPAFRTPNGWAAAALKIKDPKFCALEEEVGLDHLRPYYRLASHNVHANPKGITFRLGLCGGADLLMAGPSNYGAAEPGQNTALALAQVTSVLIQLRPTLDRLLIIGAMTELADRCALAFVDVQREIEADESVLTTKSI